MLRSGWVSVSDWTGRETFGGGGGWGTYHIGAELRRCRGGEFEVWKSVWNR